MLFLVATNAYEVDINNPKVRLVVQYNILMSFNLMIQQIDQAGRKDKILSFILLIF